MTTKQDTGMAGLLARLSTRPDEAKTTALLAYELDTSEGVIEDLIKEARRNGCLVVENDRGYFIAADYETFDRWRKYYPVREMAQSLDTLQAMGQAAREQFGRNGDDAPCIVGDTG